jgi:hypothetical protein
MDSEESTRIQAKARLMLLDEKLDLYSTGGYVLRVIMDESIY